MTTVAVIPARFASSRFPGKPLAQETGKYLVQHVCERVGECGAIDRIAVATDDPRIAEAVESFGGTVCMTRADHQTGTDRIAEAAEILSLAEGDLIVNVQGDEPEIHPADLMQVIGLHMDLRDGSQDGLHDRARGGPKERDACDIATLAVPFSKDGPCSGPGSPDDPNCVKVVVSAGGEALYFSRSLIPYPRATGGIVTDPTAYWLHLGVYAYTVAALREITSAALSPLERSESLEQLRWLEMGKRIMVATANHRAHGIDTRQDYEAFVQRVRSGQRKVATGGQYMGG